jgi:OOP family OmpA-OmpF porin
VKNSLDACPATPAGDAVDGKGCSLPKDADGDGVLNPNDQCPNTPAGDKVDAKGCSLPKDADRDGVVDANDRCPNTPAGTAVDPSGCPKVTDTDRDGVSDASDLCPDTPAGTKVDRFGCAPDADGDGVTDDRDQCPATIAGLSVDPKGCPSAFQVGEPLVLVGVNFQTGKAVILPASQGILDQVAHSLIDNPDVNVEVGGHTDALGSEAANLKLSQARADAVREYLIGKGVPAARITAMGYGEGKPVANDATAAGRAANRRVELNRTN